VFSAIYEGFYITWFINFSFGEGKIGTNAEIKTLALIIFGTIFLSIASIGLLVPLMHNVSN
jgi:hypothetical protein